MAVDPYSQAAEVIYKDLSAARGMRNKANSQGEK